MDVSQLKKPKRGEGWLDQRVDEFTRRVIIRALRKTGGSVTRTVALLQRNRTEFYRLCNRLQIDIATYRPAEERRGTSPFATVLGLDADNSGSAITG